MFADLALAAAFVTGVPKAQAHALESVSARAAILEAARKPAEAATRDRVRFVVRRLSVDGRWAFLLAVMRGVDGRPPSWVGDSKASAAAHGMMSDDLAALLWKGDDRRWSVVVYAAGPTDVVWADWPTTYGAPASLIGH